jgi:uncharacterized protein (DUF1697 family)
VKMDRLRGLFLDMGFTAVETFIASGNLVFETPETDAGALERRIATALRAALGYDVAVFLRTPAEVADIASYEAFPAAEVEAATAFNVAFLGQALDATARGRLMSLRTDIDDFAVHGREVYWLCRKRQSESTFSNAVLEKTTGQPATLRGMKTVEQMAAKYGPGGS